MSSAVCVLGRGIERVTTSGGEVWRPTRYIEALSARGSHTGRRARGISFNDEHSVIAGSNANVLAACQFFEEAPVPPGLILFAAGRPHYLRDAEPGLTEGKIMSEKFIRRVKLRPGESEVIVLSQNRDTKDDIDEVLKIAEHREIKRVVIITVAVHLARTAEFARVACECSPACVDFQFIASEELLARRNARFARLFRACEKSPAYQRTAAKEQQGIEALRSGNYRRSFIVQPTSW